MPELSDTSAESDLLDGAIVFTDNQQLIALRDPLQSYPNVTYVGADETVHQNIDLRVFWTSLLAQQAGRFPSHESASALQLHEEVLQSLPPGLADVLLKARLRFISLFNNFGGNILAYDMLYHALNTIEQNGGESISMVNGKALSMPGMFAMQTQSTVVTPSSEIMLHAQRHETQALDPVQVMRETFIIRDAVNRRIQDRIGRQIVTDRFAHAVVDPKNPQNDVHFNGKELAAWGTAELVPDVAEMEVSFMEQSGYPMDFANWKNDPIVCHFMIARLEERARTQHGVRMKFWSEKPGQLSWGIIHSPVEFAGEFQKAFFADLHKYRDQLIAHGA